MNALAQRTYKSYINDNEWTGAEYVDEDAYAYAKCDSETQSVLAPSTFSAAQLIVEASCQFYGSRQETWTNGSSWTSQEHIGNKIASTFSPYIWALKKLSQRAQQRNASASLLPATAHWIHVVRYLCDQGKEDEALKRIATQASKVKISRAYKELSDELAQVNLPQLSNAVLVALVRNTFAIRTELPSWNNLLDSISQTLEKRGKEPRLLLRGLKRL